MIFTASLLVAGVTLTGCSGSPGRESEEEVNAIEKVSVILGGEYFEDEIRKVTNEALAYAEEPLSNSSQEELWDSVLNVKKGLEQKGYPAPDSIMVVGCLPSAMDRYYATLTESIAYCSLETAGVPESEW